jgi:hypothetical protein
VPEIVHAKAGQVRPVQDPMKDTSQMALLIQLAVIIRKEQGRIAPLARHGFEFPPGAIGLQSLGQLGAAVHRSDFGGLGRFYLPGDGRGPFDSDGVLTEIQIPRLQRDRFAGTHARFRHENEQHPVARVQEPLVLK